MDLHVPFPTVAFVEIQREREREPPMSETKYQVKLVNQENEAQFSSSDACIPSCLK